MHHKVAAANDLAKQGGASVVAVGSSMVNAAIDPELLSQLLGETRPSFNGGLNGAGIRLVELWTLRVLLPRLRPNIVVIGLGSHELNSGNTVAQRLLEGLLTSSAWSDLVGEGSLWERLIRGAEKKFFVVRYRRHLGRSTLFRNPRSRQASTCRRLGTPRALLLFRFRAYRSEERQIQIWKELLNHFEVGDGEMAALGRLIDGLRAARITPLLVRMPITRDWIDLHPGGGVDFERFERALSFFALERRVPYADIASEFDSLEDYADPVHLNGKGLLRFTNILAEFIKGVPTPRPEDELR
jgi:hypothetical protein